MKKNKVIFVLFLLSLMGFLSCKKHGNVKGKVVDYFTGQPVEDAGLYLYEQYTNIWNESGGDSYKEIAKTATDANGEFNFDLEFKKRKKHYLMLTNSMVYYQQNTNYYSPSDTISEIQRIYYLDPEGLDLSGDAININTKTPSSTILKVLPSVRLKLRFEDVPGLNYWLGDSIFVNDRLMLHLSSTAILGFVYSPTIKIKYKLTINNKAEYHSEDLKIEPYKLGTYTIKF